jgi:uncharacterized damage-inducible protein DinB
MILAIGLENSLDGRSLVWALDYPGCFSAGPDSRTAIVSIPHAFLKYQEWIARHTSDSWLAGVRDFDVRLVETWQTYRIDPRSLEVVSQRGIEVGSWFRYDWKPLTMQETRRGLQMLGWSRADLLSTIQDLTPQELDVVRPGERWSIRELLGHVTMGEWGYLNRLGLTGDLPRGTISQDPIQSLATVRARLEQALPTLAGSRQVTGIDGEFWSPRKLLRYVLWHELDHIGQILKLRIP